MNIILGFGETETRHEEKIEQAFIEHVYEQYANIKADYFTDTFAKDIEKWANEFAHISQKTAQEYKTAETYPDRYSYFWVSTVWNVSHIVFIIKFHHINRRHAMSSDGWAMLESKRIFEVDNWEAGRSKREKAA